MSSLEVICTNRAILNTVRTTKIKMLYTLKQRFLMPKLGTGLLRSRSLQTRMKDQRYSQSNLLEVLSPGLGEPEDLRFCYWEPERSQLFYRYQESFLQLPEFFLQLGASRVAEGPSREWDVCEMKALMK